MKTLLNAFLFAAMTCSPALAQRYDTAQLPTADHSSPKDVVIKTDEPNQASELSASALVPTHDNGWFQVRLSAGRGETLQLKMTTELLGTPFFGLVLAAMDDTKIQIPGLPMLFLDTEIVVASGLAEDVLRFDMGPAKLPYAVFLQAVAITEVGISASSVLKVEPAQ